jgi:hypothetical protein
MATADRPTKARRTKSAPKSTRATSGRTTAAAGTKPAAAASRGRSSAGTGRQQRRTPVKAPAAKAASAQPAREDSGGLLQRTAVTLPVVNLRIPLLAPRVPDMGAATAQTKWVAQTVQANLPSTERMLYYGGLGLLAAVGALEWPVAGALGVGVWVAGRTGRRSRAQTVSA